MSQHQAITIELHGLRLAFASPDPALRGRFEEIYGRWPRSPISASSDILVEWQLYPAPTAPLPPPDLPAIVRGEVVSYYGTSNQITIRITRHGLVTVDLDRQRLSGLITSSCLEVYGAFEDVLMISLAPLYRRRGWFPLHAFAALSPAGQVALITGQMGSGKTTTGLALLEAGWKLLSNDSPLLTLQDGCVYVLAYPGRLSAFDDSLVRFDQLKRFIPPAEEMTGVSRVKRVFRAEEAFEQPWAEAGPAGGVFLPQVASGLPHSELVDMPPAAAVAALMPQAIEGWDKAMIGQNLYLLGQLAQQVPSYVLRLSPEVNKLPGLIARGMEKLPVNV